MSVDSIMQFIHFYMGLGKFTIEKRSFDTQGPFPTDHAKMSPSMLAFRPKHFNTDFLNKRQLCRVIKLLCFLNEIFH